MQIDSSFLFDIARELYSDLSYISNSGKSFMPLRYILELTYRCNLTCPFCYLGKERNLNELSTEEWLNVIKQIPRYAFISLLGGEIFLRKDLPVIFEQASKHVFGKLNLYTNGTLISDEELSNIMKNKFLLFSVSLDGIGSVHDNLRQKNGVFDKSFESLLLVKKKRGRKKYPLIEVKSVVLNKNLDELPKLYKLCIENEFDFITFSFIRTTSLRQNPILKDNFDNELYKQNYPIKQYFDMEHFIEIYKELESLSKNTKTLLRWAPKFKPTGDLEKIKQLFEKGNLSPSKLYKPCKFPYHDIFINPEGIVYPCMPINMGSIKEYKLS
ncbi:radical SAM protein [bacterium]|nr:radical SAM protein [bacterium]